MLQPYTFWNNIQLITGSSLAQHWLITGSSLAYHTVANVSRKEDTSLGEIQYANPDWLHARLDDVLLAILHALAFPR